MKRTVTVFLVAFMALGTGLAFGAGQRADREDRVDPVGQEDRVDREDRDDRDGLTGNLYRISKINNFGIIGQADEQIGNVDEAVLTLEGQVTHLIAHLYGLEGLEGGRYLVPFDAISLYDTENITLDAQRAQEFAGFDDGHSAWQLPEGTVRSFDILGYNVVGPRDEVIANTEDLVVDLETGQVVYLAIGSGGFLGIGRYYYAISFDPVLVEVAEARVRIDMTEEDLARLEDFDQGQWPHEGSGRRIRTTQVSTHDSE